MDKNKAGEINISAVISRNWNPNQAKILDKRLFLNAGAIKKDTFKFIAESRLWEWNSAWQNLLSLLIITLLCKWISVVEGDL